MGNAIIIKGADFSKNALGTITPESGRIAINVIANPAEGGTVTGGGKYDEGSVVQLSAIPSEDYKFKNWNDGVAQQVRSVTVGTEDKSYTANFVIDKGIIDTLSSNDFYYVGWSSTRRLYLIANVKNADAYKIKVAVNEDSNIKVGVQVYSVTGTEIASLCSQDPEKPKAAPANKIHDFGWITAGQSAIYDKTSYDLIEHGGLGICFSIAFNDASIVDFPTLDDLKRNFVIKMTGVELVS